MKLDIYTDNNRAMSSEEKEAQKSEWNNDVAG